MIQLQSFLPFKLGKKSTINQSRGSFSVVGSRRMNGYRFVRRNCSFGWPLHLKRFWLVYLCLLTIFEHVKCQCPAKTSLFFCWTVYCVPTGMLSNSFVKCDKWLGKSNHYRCYAEYEMKHSMYAVSIINIILITCATQLKMARAMFPFPLLNMTHA